MTTQKIQKIVKEAPNKVSKDVINLATYIVDNECTKEDGSPILGEQRDILRAVTCLDIAAGKLLSKGQYLVIGGACGIVLSAGVIVLYKIIKKRRESQQ